jgi:hypothetical protein
VGVAFFFGTGAAAGRAGAAGDVLALGNAFGGRAGVTTGLVFGGLPTPVRFGAVADGGDGLLGAGRAVGRAAPEGRATGARTTGGWAIGGGAAGARLAGARTAGGCATVGRTAAGGPDCKGLTGVGGTAIGAEGIVFGGEAAIVFVGRAGASDTTGVGFVSEGGGVAMLVAGWLSPATGEFNGPGAGAAGFDATSPNIGAICGVTGTSFGATFAV